MLKEVLEVIDLLDGWVTGNEVATFLESNGAENVIVTSIDELENHTDFIRVQINGIRGKSRDGNTPTLGVVGRLGGIGARPNRIGLVSDADAAITAIAVALKLVRMQDHNDLLNGDVIICTHICPNAPTIDHDPVLFMGSPVDMETLNRYEVSDDMDALIAVDATKGNFVINHRGIAITPTVKEGYLLPVSYPLLDILSYTTGKLPQVLPLSQYDVTPYGNDLFHVNSILQPSIVTSAPVIGLALTSQVIIPGCATGSNQELDIRDASTFCIEVAKVMEKGLSLFYDESEFSRALGLYGDMKRFQKTR